MDVTLQRHCARYIYVVPEGLRELMSDISREVLRSQPANIYSFIADYLDALLITRENARVAAKLVQNIAEIGETIVEFLTRTQMSREEADRIATIIQDAFRAYLQRKHPPHENEEAEFVAKILEEAQISEEIAEEAATVIQIAFRKFLHRKEKEEQLLSGIIDWRVAARSAIQLYRKSGVSTEEAKRAATLIKAAYKGYYTRRMIKRLAEETANRVEDLSCEEEDFNELRRDSQDSRPSKSVRINYETVKPHVDFGDPTIITEEEREGAKSVAREILEQLFQAAVPEDSPPPVVEPEMHRNDLPIVEGKPSFKQNSTQDFVKKLVMEEIIDPIFKDEPKEKVEEPKEVVEEPFVKEYVAPLIEEGEETHEQPQTLESDRSGATSAPTTEETTEAATTETEDVTTD